MVLEVDGRQVDIDPHRPALASCLLARAAQVGRNRAPLALARRSPVELGEFLVLGRNGLDEKPLRAALGAESALAQVAPERLRRPAIRRSRSRLLVARETKAPTYRARYEASSPSPFL